MVLSFRLCGNFQKDTLIYRFLSVLKLQKQYYTNDNTELTIKNMMVIMCLSSPGLPWCYNRNCNLHEYPFSDSHPHITEKFTTKITKELIKRGEFFIYCFFS